MNATSGFFCHDECVAESDGPKQEVQSKQKLRGEEMYWS
jgi:hypothetical protein